MELRIFDGVCLWVNSANERGLRIGVVLDQVYAGLQGRSGTINKRKRVLGDLMERALARVGTLGLGGGTVARLLVVHLRYLLLQVLLFLQKHQLKLHLPFLLLQTIPMRLILGFADCLLKLALQMVDRELRMRHHLLRTRYRVSILRHAVPGYLLVPVCKHLLLRLQLPWLRCAPNIGGVNLARNKAGRVQGRPKILWLACCFFVCRHSILYKAEILSYGCLLERVWPEANCTRYRICVQFAG